MRDFCWVVDMDGWEAWWCYWCCCCFGGGVWDVLWPVAEFFFALGDSLLDVFTCLDQTHKFVAHNHARRKWINRCSNTLDEEYSLLCPPLWLDHHLPLVSSTIKPSRSLHSFFIRQPLPDTFAALPALRFLVGKKMTEEFTAGTIICCGNKNRKISHTKILRCAWVISHTNRRCNEVIRRYSSPFSPISPWSQNNNRELPFVAVVVSWFWRVCCICGRSACQIPERRTCRKLSCRFGCTSHTTDLQHTPWRWCVFPLPNKQTNNKKKKQPPSNPFAPTSQTSPQLTSTRERVPATATVIYCWAFFN